MEDIHSLKPAIDLPLLTDGEKWTLITISILLLCALLTWLYLRFGRRYFAKKEVISEKEVIRIDYQKEVRGMLVTVKKILDTGDYKKFHLELSKLLKLYLSHKYDFAASDMTSHEILREKKLVGNEKVKVDEFFYKNNLAKFASRGLEREVALEVLGKVEEIIRV